MNAQPARLNDQIIRQVREHAAHAVTPEMIPRIVFDVLQESVNDPAHTARLQDVKLLLVEAYRAAGVSARVLDKRPIVA
jgi:hypothetical protein